MGADDLRRTFDTNAELYDRARPGYPDAVFDDLVDLAGLTPGARLLEIGAGTGQATLPLVGRGLSVSAVELGSALADELQRKTVGMPVEVVRGAFEEVVLASEHFDAVAAFTAWHWLAPELRIRRAHAALRPGGSLITVTTTHVRGGTEQFFDDVQSCYERWDPATPKGLRTQPSDVIPPVLDEADESDLFEPAVRRRYQQDITYTADGYLEVLSTYSGHIALPAQRRAGLFACIRALIESQHQGQVTKRYLYELRVARCRSG